MKYAVVQYLIDEPDAIMELFGPFDTEEQAIKRAINQAEMLVKEHIDCIESPENVIISYLKDLKYVDYPFAMEQHIAVRPLLD